MTTYSDMVYALGGVPTVGGELPLITGTVFFVSSDTGSDSNTGKSLEGPLATIDAAVGKCTADKGDAIIVLPGHTESIITAGAIDLDVAGITVWGVGNGSLKPTITAATSADADIDVDAADIRIHGLRFVCNIANQTSMIDVNKSGCTIDHCEFVEGSATGIAFVDINGGAANACDDAKILYNYFYAPTAGNYDRAIELGEVADSVEIGYNVIIGDFDDAGIHNPTGKILTYLNVHHNIVANYLTGQHAIELVSACTGSLTDNRLYADTDGTVLDPGSLMCMGNLASTVIDSGGWSVPATADVTDNYIGYNDNDNAADTTNVVANADGSVLERLELLQGQQAGTAGIATWLTAAAYASNVSLSEVIAYIQDAVRNGSGAGMGTNKGVADALGTNGATVTDSAVSVLGAIGADNANNAFASTSVAANEDGSVLERLEQVQEVVNNGTGTAAASNKSIVDMLGTNGTTAAVATAASAVSLFGAIGTNEADATTTFTSANVQSNADGTVLEREEYIQAAVAALQTDLGDPSSRTNLQTLVAMLGNPDTANQSLWDALGGGGGLATYPSALAYANGVSLAEVIAYIQDAVRNGSGTAMATNKSVADALGTNGTTVTDSAVSVLGAIGANSADNAFASTLVAANEDGSVLERLEQVQEVVNNGTGSPAATNKSLVDMLGTNGTTAAVATAASAVSLFGAIGTNEADATTPFTSANVQSNADGTVLEREEYIQTAVDAIAADLGDPSARTNLKTILAMLGNPDVANQSLWDALGGGGGLATFPNGAAPANDVSLAEVLRDIWDAVRNGTGGTEPGTNRSVIDEIKGSALNYNAVNYLAVTVDLSQAAWNTMATHTVFAVTGLVRLRYIIECTVEGNDTSGDTATIQLGHVGATNDLIAATQVDDLTVGELWLDATPAETYGAFATLMVDRISNGIDIGFEIAGEAATAGTLVFHCWWEPLNGTGVVTAGTGQVLA